LIKKQLSLPNHARYGIHYIVSWQQSASIIGPLRERSRDILNCFFTNKRSRFGFWWDGSIDSKLMLIHLNLISLEGKTIYLISLLFSHGHIIRHHFLHSNAYIQLIFIAQLISFPFLSRFLQHATARQSWIESQWDKLR